MKPLNTYIIEQSVILESDDNWLDAKISELSDTNTNGELKTITVLYGIRMSDWNRTEVYDGYNRLQDKAPGDNANYAYVTSALSIDVVTTDKGNFYGVTKNLVDGKPKLASFFNKRVKGTKGHVWTNSIDNIKAFITEFSKRFTLDIIPSSSKEWVYYYAYTSKEKAETAAEKKGKLHKQNVNVVWHEEKIKQLKDVLDARKKDIEYYKKRIQEVEDEIKDIETDIAEYETIKNLTATDFNESLQEINSQE